MMVGYGCSAQSQSIQAQVALFLFGLVIALSLAGSAADLVAILATIHYQLALSELESTWLKIT